VSVMGLLVYTPVLWMTLSLTPICELKEYCWPSKFNVTCPDNHVILVKTAKYGRMERGPCLTSDISIGCQADVLIEVDKRCSGRTSCVIAIPDTVMHAASLCPDDMLAYLEADYQCVKVQPSLPSCGYSEPELLKSSLGYLGSPSSDFHSPTQCTWKIQVEVGQRVNITLYDFSISHGHRDDPGTCLVYAILQERRGGTHNVCRGLHRERNVYTSESNQVDIQVFADADSAPDAGYFLLKYEAIGCSEPPVPKDAWFKRTDDKVAISCNHSAETWYLYCAGAAWIGPRRNCSASPSQIISTEQNNDDKNSIFPYSKHVAGLFTAVVIGIITGVVFGVVLLAVVLSCERRRRRKARLQGTTNAPKNSVVDYLAEGEVSPSLNDERKSARYSQYGYTHVWELKNINNMHDTENHCNTIKSHQIQGGGDQQQLTVDTTAAAAVGYCEHTYRCPEHNKYPSPRHQIYNTSEGCKALTAHPQCYHDIYHQEPDYQFNGDTNHLPPPMEVDLVIPVSTAN